MAIVWRDQMSVGHDEIDHDHKTLIDLINTFEDTVNAGADRFRVLDVLGELKKYTTYHFAREERVQVRIGYPFHAAHVQEHKRLMAKLDRLSDELSSNLDPVIDDEEREVIATFLRSWLLDHIIEQDLRMRRYLPSPRAAVGAV